jgi:hypothetical protein
VETVRAAAIAGVHLIQLRERTLDDRDLAALAGECVTAVRGTARGWSSTIAWTSRWRHARTECT